MRYDYILEHGTLLVAGNSTPVWTHWEAPSAQELAEVLGQAKLPAHLIKDITDPNEMPHMDSHGDIQIIFLDVPVVLDDIPKHQTRPICVLLEQTRLTTISAFSFNLPQRITSGAIDAVDDTKDVLFLIMFSIMAAYIEMLKEMENQSNWDTKVFRAPPDKNTMFIELLDLQKSMIDFTTSVDANHNVLLGLQQKESGIIFLPHQTLLLQNAIVESNQISTMCSVFSSVLDTTGNIAESIVSNNLNDVMKTLTSLTILFSVPTIITAVFTMNTAIPDAVNHIAFPILFSLLMGGLVLWFLKKRRML